MPISKNSKNKKPKTYKRSWLQFTGGFWIDILITIGVFAVIILFFIGLFIYGDYEDHQTFKNYEAFAKMTMPNNFKLTRTQENPNGIDNTANVDQDYQVSSTRYNVVEELKQVFTKYGYTYNSETSTNEYGYLSDPQIFTNSNAHNDYPLTIYINFTPGDCYYINKNTSDNCLQTPETLPSNVTGIFINWASR